MNKINNKEIAFPNFEFFQFRPNLKYTKLSKPNSNYTSSTNLFSWKKLKKKIPTFTILVPTVYIKLVFQTIANLHKSILPHLVWIRHLFFFATFFSLLETNFKKCIFFSGTLQLRAFFFNILYIIFFLIKFFLFFGEKNKSHEICIFCFQKKTKKKNEKSSQQQNFSYEISSLPYFVFLAKYYFMLFLPKRTKNPLS